LGKKIKREYNNNSLHNAHRNKMDEFYTQYSDIEKELKYYKDKFKNKIVYCNCDDPEISNFYKYFSNNFEHLGLKKLICTHYSLNEKTYKLVIEKDRNKDGKINGKDVERYEFMFSDGDFRSDECVELLKESDIVCTNPPFSLFREYVAQLIEHKKKFLIIGNQNAITYKEIFELIKDNKIWLGMSIHSGDREFRVPDYYPLRAAGFRVDENGVKYIRVKGVRWWTNIDYKERHEEFIPKKYKKYKGNEKDYPKYDNYNAINIDKSELIPIDYKGVMGVPITFLDKYNPGQFEIIGQGQGNLYRELTTKGLKKEFVNNYYKTGGTGSIKEDHPVLGYYDKNGKAVIPYMRILIKRVKGE